MSETQAVAAAGRQEPAADRDTVKKLASLASDLDWIKLRFNHADQVQIARAVHLMHGVATRIDKEQQYGLYWREDDEDDVL